MMEAIDPGSGKVIHVEYSQQKLLSLKGMGKGRILEAYHCVGHVLKRPSAVFEGLTNDKDHDPRGTGWRCYIGKPDKCFEDDGKQTIPRRDLLLAVFVNDQNVVYNWYWCRCDPAHPDLPMDWKSRFRRQLL